MVCQFSRANKNESFQIHLEHLNCKLAILHQLKTSNCPSLQAIRKGVLHYLINAVGLLDTLEQSNELEKIQLKKYSCDVRLECTTQLHPVRTERELSAKKRLGALEQQHHYWVATTIFHFSILQRAMDQKQPRPKKERSPIQIMYFFTKA